MRFFFGDHRGNTAKAAARVPAHAQRTGRGDAIADEISLHGPARAANQRP